MGTNARQRAEVVEWLNGMFPTLRIPADISEEDLRRRLVDGTILCCLMKKLNPGTVFEVEFILVIYHYFLTISCFVIERDRVSVIFLVGL